MQVKHKDKKDFLNGILSSKPHNLMKLSFEITALNTHDDVITPFPVLVDW